MKSIATALLSLSLFLAAPAHAVLVCDGDNTNGVFWYVGQPTDAIRAVGFDTGVECFATAKELTYIGQGFLSVRARSGAKFVLWTGEDAQFIVDNL